MNQMNEKKKKKEKTLKKVEKTKLLNKFVWMIPVWTAEWSQPPDNLFTFLPLKNSILVGTLISSLESNPNLPSEADPHLLI